MDIASQCDRQYCCWRNLKENIKKQRKRENCRFSSRWHHSLLKEHHNQNTMRTLYGIGKNTFTRCTFVSPVRALLVKSPILRLRWRSLPKQMTKQTLQTFAMLLEILIGKIIKIKMSNCGGPFRSECRLLLKLSHWRGWRSERNLLQVVVPIMPSLAILVIRMVCLE